MCEEHPDQHMVTMAAKAWVSLPNANPSIRTEPPVPPPDFEIDRDAGERRLPRSYRDTHNSGSTSLARLPKEPRRPHLTRMTTSSRAT